MAKKESTEKKIVLERTFNIPLRKEYMKSARWKRTNKAVIACREFLAKHMKSDNIKLGKYLNEEFWKDGIKSPPHHVKVTAKKDEDGVVKAELVGAPEEKKPEPEKKGKKAAAEKKEEKPAGKKEEKPAKEEKAEEPKSEKPVAEKEAPKGKPEPAKEDKKAEAPSK